MKLKYFVPFLMTVLPLQSILAKGLGKDSLQINTMSIGNEVYNAVVDAGGNGDYKTIQDAISAAPTGRTAPWLIFVKSGDYNEVVVVPQEKTFIYLIGQDKTNTIIHYKLNVQSQPKADSKWYQNDTAAWKYSVHNPESNVYKAPGEVVTINAADFYAENISFVNDWGVESQNGPQALALSTQADRIAFNNCIFRSFQDTWMTSTRNGLNNRLYVNNCWIEGAVDYFYGGGNAYVEKSTFYNVRSGSVIVAPSHKEGTQWGYVFDHCTIDGNAAAADGKLKMGRPWHDRPIAVYLNTIMKIPVSKEGWTDMGAIPAIFTDYKSVDAQGNPVSTSERKTVFKDRNTQKDGTSKAVLTDAEAAKYTYSNVLSGLDNWNPRTLIAQNSQPFPIKFSSENLSWRAVDNAAGYIVYKNNQVIGFTKATSFPVNKKDKGSYSVQRVNKFGSLGAHSTELKVS